MSDIQNHTLTGADGRPFLIDLMPANKAKGTLLFAHGFKGFKDWGHWRMLGEAFRQAGYTWVAFNFSHNGTTTDAPEAFHDLEAFGQNNYSKELHDLQVVIDWLHSGPDGIPPDSVHLDTLCLIGHSRGGPIALITAAEDERVDRVITWASVAGLDYAWPDDSFIDQWRDNGVYHVINGRTGQEMPLRYQLYEDFRAHADRLDIDLVAARITQPVLVVHGTADPAVPQASAMQLEEMLPQAELVLIQGADHVFGGRHPMPDGAELSPHARQLLKTSLQFLYK